MLRTERPKRCVCRTVKHSWPTVAGMGAFGRLDSTTAGLCCFEFGMNVARRAPCLRPGTGRGGPRRLVRHGFELGSART